MAKKRLLFQSHDVISSFSTKHPKALLTKVPWVISKDTTMTDAASRIFDDGYADLIVLDPETGDVFGLLSDFDNTATLSSKKKKKKRETTVEMQVECHTMCVAECAARGGCKNHAVVHSKGGDPYCAIQCNDNLEDTVGNVIAKGAFL